MFHYLKLLPRRFRPAKAAIKMNFFNAFGYAIDLENPVTFNEKLNWIKLYDRNPLMTKCADKYGVREYVTERVGAHILNELYSVYNSVSEIDFSTLPQRCTLKLTHGSGFNIFVDNGKFSIKKKQLRSLGHAKYRLRKWRIKKQHIRAQEWCYKNIRPRIICERYLENTANNLVDYKIHCFAGKSHFIEVATGRRSGTRESFFNTEWEELPFRWGTTPIEEKVIPPKCLSEILNMAEALSAPFPYVRVDFYEYNDQPIFGEMSFQCGAGYTKFTPQKWDTIFGELLTLPQAN